MTFVRLLIFHSRVI